MTPSKEVFGTHPESPKSTNEQDVSQNSGFQPSGPGGPNIQNNQNSSLLLSQQQQTRQALEAAEKVRAEEEFAKKSSTGSRTMEEHIQKINESAMKAGF